VDQAGIRDIRERQIHCLKMAEAADVGHDTVGRPVVGGPELDLDNRLAISGAHAAPQRARSSVLVSLVILLPIENGGSTGPFMCGHGVALHPGPMDKPPATIAYHQHEQH